jgi:predicted transcriptional regulator
LENCKTCEVKTSNTYYRPEIACAECEIYKQLRAIGDKLGEGIRMGKAVELTVEKYRDYKTKGYTDGKIAEELGCTPTTISNWKKKNIKPFKVVETPKETNAPKETKQPPQNELQSVVEALKRQLDVREKAIEQQKENLENLKVASVPRYKHNELENDYKESELERIKNFEEFKKVDEAYQQQRSIIINLDAELENVREQLRQAREEAVKAGQENEHLKGLVKLWM